MVEQGIVYPQVAGSSPVVAAIGCVVQLDRTSVYETEDRGSNPCMATKSGGSSNHAQLIHTPNPHHHTHTLSSPIAQLAEALVLETSDGGSNPSWGTHPSIVYGAPAPLLTTSPWDHVSRGKQKANAQFFENQIFLCKSEKNLRFPGIFFQFHL